MNASKLGSSGIGVVFDKGVLLIVEKKKKSKLVERSGLDKVAEIDDHIKCIVSGLIVDSIKPLENARSEAHHHNFVYNHPINVKPLAQSFADEALNFGEGDITTETKPIARPYGVSLLFGGIDTTGPCLYHTDPSGTLIGYKACGVGSA